MNNLLGRSWSEQGHEEVVQVQVIDNCNANIGIVKLCPLVTLGKKNLRGLFPPFFQQQNQNYE